MSSIESDDMTNSQADQAYEEAEAMVKAAGAMPPPISKQPTPEWLDKKNHPALANPLAGAAGRGGASLPLQPTRKPSAATDAANQLGGMGIASQGEAAGSGETAQFQRSTLTESVVAKLGDGFVLGGIKDLEGAPGDGEIFIPHWGMVSVRGLTAKEDLNDLEGNKIGEILYQSNNIDELQRSARVVANDGTTLFTFDRPKVSKDDKNPAYPIMLHGTTPYASAIDESFPDHFMGKFPANHLQGQLTRLDGSGGLRIGKRISKQGYLACLLAAFCFPTLLLDLFFCCCFISTYLMQHMPVIIALESLDGATQFTPMLEVKGKQMVPFQSAAIPLKHAEHAKKYVEEKSPQPLDGAARIDALILFVVSKAAVTLRFYDTQ